LERAAAELPTWNSDAKAGTGAPALERPGANIADDPEKVLFFTQPQDRMVPGGTWARCKLQEFKRPVSRVVEEFDV